MAIITTNEDANSLANELLGKYVFACMEDTEDLYIYDSGVFKLNGEVVIKKYVEGERADTTNHFINEVIGHVKRRTYIQRSEFDNDPYILNLINGYYDLKTDVFTPHVGDDSNKPAHLSLIQYPFEFDTNAICPIITKFIETTHIDDEGKAMMYEDVAGCFVRIPMKGFTIHVGPNDSGKSTWLNFIRAMIGPDSVPSVKLQALAYDRFKAAELFGKAVNIYADIPSEALEKVGDLKVVTGMDSLCGERKFQNPFYFIPKCRQIYSCNTPPEMPEDSNAIYTRIRMIHWFKSFPKGSSERDEHILEKMTQPQELSGFLNKLLPYIKYIIEHKQYQIYQSDEQIRTDYKEMANHMDKFCAAWIIADPNSHTPKGPLYSTAYFDFCRESKTKPMSQQAFNTKLAQRFTIYEKRKDDIRMWFGIKTTKEIPKALDEGGMDEHLK